MVIKISEDAFPFTKCPYCKQFLSVFDKDALFCENHTKAFSIGALQDIYGINFRIEDLLDDKEWLDYMYSYSYQDASGNYVKRRGFSLAQLSSMLEVPSEAVRAKLEGHNIPLRSDDPKDKDFYLNNIYNKKEWLYKEYHEKNKTIKEIAKEHKIDEAWIEDRLEKEGLLFKITRSQPTNLIKMIEKLMIICVDGSKEYFVCSTFLTDVGLLPDEIELLRSVLWSLGVKNRIVRRKNGKLAGNWVGFFDVPAWDHDKKIEFCPSDCSHRDAKCKKIVGLFLDKSVLSQIMAFVSNFEIKDGSSEVARLNRAFWKFKERDDERTKKTEIERKTVEETKRREIESIDAEIAKKKKELEDFRALKSKNSEILGYPFRFFYEKFVGVYRGEKPTIEWTGNDEIDKRTYQTVIDRLKNKEHRLTRLLYTADEWADMRIEILKRDAFVCQSCKYKPSRQVHHIADAYFFPEKSLDPANLMTLCDKCHEAWGKGNKDESM